MDNLQYFLFCERNAAYFGRMPVGPHRVQKFTVGFLKNPALQPSNHLHPLAFGLGVFVFWLCA